MSFPEYRRAIELSDEEILDIMRIVYPDLDSGQPDAAHIKSISRDDDTVAIEAESAYTLFEDEIEEDGERFGWAKDGFEINDEEGSSHTTSRSKTWSGRFDRSCSRLDVTCC